MTPVSELTNNLSVAGQIQPEDVKALAEHGYQLIICNRPDNEEPNQPSMDAIEAACDSAGIQFLRYPVDARSFPGDDLDVMDEAMNGDARVLAYCRSGTRSTNLWVATLAGDDRLAAAERAQQFGYPLTFVMQLGFS